MTIINIHFKTILAVSFSALLFSCVGVSPKANFYTLNTINTTQKVADITAQNDHAHARVRIQIMPISIDETVDRPQIVITSSQNQVQFLEQQRWAQPLKYEVGRVVGQHLNQLIPNSIVSAYPHQLSDSGVQLSLEVIAFESSFTTPAKIKVNYTVLNTKTKQSMSQSQEYSQPLTSDNHPINIGDIIEAHSQNILQLSQDVASAFNKL